LSSRNIKIVTANILRDISRWEQRRSLLVDGLASFQADILALQEVALPEDNAAWLAEQLNLLSPEDRQYTRYLCPKTGGHPEEGIAILSRLPVEEYATLDLGSQKRVAQLIKVNTGARPLVCANVHLYWFPGKSKERIKQVERLLSWLDPFSRETGLVLCGDFNSPPQSPTIQKVEQSLVSAYKDRHGEEPPYTVPTGLPVSKLFQATTLLRLMLANWRQIPNIKPGWRGTLDYIFVNNRVKVNECDLILNQTAPGYPRIFPSDHFGLFARLAQGDPPENRKNVS
jgi:endonuclease/exonuclease/phosphatase family metal-dependent hydrolase